MTWENTYNVTPRAVIHEEKPGEKIAKVLKEIQEKAIVACKVSGISATVNVKNNVLHISFDELGSDALPDGGETWQVLTIGTDGQPTWDWTRAHE